METSEGTLRGNMDSLYKLIAALDAIGVELIGEGATREGGGRRVRLKIESLKQSVTIMIMNRKEWNSSPCRYRCHWA